MAATRRRARNNAERQPKPEKPLTAEEAREIRLANLRRGGGRTPGVPNRVTVEMKRFCNDVLSDPVYVASVWRRIRNDTLPPAVETMFYYYAAGKPKERVEFGADKTLADLVAEAANRKLADLQKPSGK